MTARFTTKMERRLRAILKTSELPKGLGTYQNPSSMAAINLAISEELVPYVPDCMSLVIGKWVLIMNDAVPHCIRNSKRWKKALPLAAKSGQDHEEHRANILVEWLWNDIMPLPQNAADLTGLGREWHTLLEQRSSDAAGAVYLKALRKAERDCDLTANRLEAITANAGAVARRQRAIVSGEGTPEDFVKIGIRSAEAALCAANDRILESADMVWRELDPCDLLERLCQPPDPQ